MQENIDCWEGVAKCTGGALEPKKSWWYLIHYQWDKYGNWKYGDNEGFENNSLTARDKSNHRVDLEYLPTEIGKKC